MKVEQIEKKMQKRKQEFEQAVQDASKIVTSDLPLYRKLEKNYKDKVLMPELERKKEALKSIRSLHQPLDLDNIKQHARAYSQKRIETIENKKQERENKIKEELKNYGFLKNKSTFLENVLQTEKELKEINDMKNSEKLELQEKKKSYSQLIQQMHPPIISRK